MPTGTPQKTIWMDGHAVPWHEAKIHVSTNALHYATSVLEGIRVYNGKPFLLAKHMHRFLESAALLKLSVPYSEDELCNAVLETIDIANVQDAYVRPIAWLGDESIELSYKGLSTHVAIMVLPMDQELGFSRYTEGIRIMISSWSRPAPHTAPVLAKTAATYPLSIMARAEAQHNGYHDALLLDYRGYLAEATGANVFLVIEGELHTPIPECFLNGLTRQLMMEIGAKEGIKVVERALHPRELQSAQEVFLTGTACEIVPVREILDVGDYPYGPLTRHLQEKFKLYIQEHSAGH